ncbi:hypothetical protein DL96DRAFT_1744393 [Flagelloscypha sp. PMI_526]|nr:hypothetical protein DL96DRAFT_1744393 [Flagelloscypha sp. PMI_526]
MKMKRTCSHTVSFQLRPELPNELWQHIAKYLSCRELESASFLHSTLSQIHEGIKYKELRIDLSFPGCYNRTSPAELSAKRLAYCHATNNSHHVQTLRLNSHYGLSRHYFAHLPLSLSRFLLNKRPFKPSSNLLQGFENIKALYLDCLIISQVPYYLNTPRHPFTTLLWNHFGARLTQLHIKHTGEGGRVLPPEGAISRPLPCLQAFTLDFDFNSWIYLGSDDIETFPLCEIRLIASLYIGSTTLKSLTLSNGALIPTILPLLLSSPESPFPLLERFCAKIGSHEKPGWNTNIMTFLSAHVYTLKSLYIAASLPHAKPLISRWLGALIMPPAPSETTQQANVFTPLGLDRLECLDWFSVQVKITFQARDAIVKKPLQFKLERMLLQSKDSAPSSSRCSPSPQKSASLLGWPFFCRGGPYCKKLP